MTVLQTELAVRWRNLFTALAAGDDVAPTERLRTEGMMEAAVMLHLATADELLGAMEEAYEEAFGRDIADDFGLDWRDFFPFPQIPAMGRRAPVYPSTRD